VRQPFVSEKLSKTLIKMLLLLLLPLPAETLTKLPASCTSLVPSLRELFLWDTSMYRLKHQ
jgi:hypothetical protein